MFNTEPTIASTPKVANKTIRGTKKDADRYLTGKLRDKDLGVIIEPSSISLDKYLTQWLQTAAKPRVRQRTFEDYEALLRRYVREPLGTIKISNLRALDIQGLYKSMQDRELSPRVIRYTHAVLSSALKQAVKWGMLHRNPAELVDLPKSERKEMKAMSLEEVRRFLGAVKGTRASALFEFALATGMKPQEYLGLKWTDIDFKKGTATVRRALAWSQKKGGGWSFSEPKTTRSRRTLPLPPSMVKALAHHKRRQGEDRLRAGSEWQDHGLVFSSRMGAPLSAPALSKAWFKPALVRAELPTTFRLYDLRHTHATMLLADGENPKVAAERLGHSTIVLTLDTYSHVLPDMQKQAAARIERLMFRRGRA